MDTVQSWLDANEVRRMAEDLMSPASQKELVQSDAAYHEGFTGYADQSQDQFGSVDQAPRVSVSKALASARKVAEGSGMLQASQSSISNTGNVISPPSKESIIEAPQSDICEVDPLKILMLSEQWVKQFNLRSMVVMAPNAVVLFDTLGNTKLTQMAQKLANGAPVAGNLFVRIGAGACLQVVHVSIGRGDLIFGLLLSAALSSDQISILLGQVSEKWA